MEVDINLLALGGVVMMVIGIACSIMALIFVFVEIRTWIERNK